MNGDTAAVQVTNAPFFIVGTGRSGTTLLRLVLAGHSRIEIPPETWFIMPLVSRLPLTAPLAPAQVNQAIDIMTAEYRWPDMRIDAAQFREAALAMPAPRLAQIIDLVYQAHLQRSGKQRIGDKTPRYIGIAPELLAMYPDAKFIHMIRDGRDVAMSYIDAGWHDTRQRYFDGKEFQWRYAIDCDKAYRSGVMAGRMLTLHYEDFVCDTESWARRICDFLGERFEPDMLDHRQRVTSMVPPREAGAHRALTDPINAERIGNWRRKLSWIECLMMESCLYPELTYAGYELRFSNPAWRPLMLAVRHVLAIVGPSLKRVVLSLQRRKLLQRRIYI